MGLVLITLLLITIGLELCLSHDNDKLVLDYAAELNERSVVLPPGLNGGELCFYQSVPSYWAGTWKIEAYHTAKSNPDVTLIVNGPYRDEEVTRGHPNREKPKPGKGIKAKVLELGSSVFPNEEVGILEVNFSTPGIYSICFRNENAKSGAVVVWFDINPHDGSRKILPATENGTLIKGSHEETRHDLRLVRNLINNIEWVFYDLEKEHVLLGKKTYSRYVLLDYLQMRIAFIYIFEIFLFLGVTVGQILVVKAWFRRR